MKNFLIVLLLVVAMGCKKDNNTTAADAPVVMGTGLPGTWELRYSIGGLAAVKTNYPAGNGHLMVFTSEGYQILDKGNLIRQGSYALIQQQSYLLNKVTSCITFDNDKPITLIDLNGNQVSFALDAIDGGSSTYERIK
ncbi:hypothetical protein ACFGVR_06430 [Mucilaginibacter sp. AW1-3]